MLPTATGPAMLTGDPFFSTLNGLGGLFGGASSGPAISGADSSATGYANMNSPFIVGGEDGSSPFTWFRAALPIVGALGVIWLLRR